jgi:hypothetical protein
MAPPFSPRPRLKQCGRGSIQDQHEDQASVAAFPTIPPAQIRPRRRSGRVTLNERWGEIAAMVISFLVAAYSHFVHARLGFAPLGPTLALVTGVLISTLGWLAVTLLTPPTDRAVLQSFYTRSARLPQDGSVLFATGYLLYGRLAIGPLCAVLAVASVFGLRQVIPHLPSRFSLTCAPLRSQFEANSPQPNGHFGA